jgi:anti-sigma B factor antagonist
LVTETKTRKIEPDITVIEISGRLNLGNILLSLESSIRRMIDDGARKLIVDVSTLTYIDSAGVGVLVGCNGRVGQCEGQLRIVGAQGPVARTFDLVHMSMIVPLDADLESACRHLSAGGAAAH